MPKVLGPVPNAKEDRYKCPICGAPVVLSCRCFRADSSCENNHHWHTCVKHQVFVEGHSDHALDISACTCGADDQGLSIDPDVRTVVMHMGWTKSFDDLLAVVESFAEPVGELHVEMLADPEDAGAPSSIIIEIATEMSHYEFREFQKRFYRTARLIDEDLANRISLLRK